MPTAEQGLAKAKRQEPAVLRNHRYFANFMLFHVILAFPYFPFRHKMTI
jgi:hypothetical protein